MDDSDGEALERRLAAVERALSDGDPLEHRESLDDLERRIAELEAAVQAIRGYVGSVRAVNEEVERRADLALRKVTVLERHLEGVDSESAFDFTLGDGPDGGSMDGGESADVGAIDPDSTNIGEADLDSRPASNDSANDTVSTGSRPDRDGDGSGDPDVRDERDDGEATGDGQLLDRLRRLGRSP